MLNLDPNTEFAARVARRLADDTIIWLTTVRPNGTPEPSPVWFLWDGATALIYSRPNTQKLRNIVANSNVALSFNTTSDGGDVIILSGTAAVDEQAPSCDQLPAYVAKYAGPIQGINMTPEHFAKAYSVAIRVTPTKVRGH
jgi:PPOX class probable F420-dependent enzyme